MWNRLHEWDVLGDCRKESKPLPSISKRFFPVDILPS